MRALGEAGEHDDAGQPRPCLCSRAMARMKGGPSLCLGAMVDIMLDGLLDGMFGTGPLMLFHAAADGAFIEGSAGPFDGTFDRRFHGMCDGMFDGMFDGTSSGRHGENDELRLGSSRAVDWPTK